MRIVTNMQEEEGAAVTLDKPSMLSVPGDSSCLYYRILAAVYYDLCSTFINRNGFDNFQ